ncbi:MAG: glycosyltransferase [Aeromicrobium sp.]
MLRTDLPVLAVVVPARDEQRLLPACLAALHAAIRHVGGVEVDLTVVADACSDRTAEIAARAGAHVLETDGANVGAARALGCAAALERHAARSDRLWLATTDADSLVPTGWLDAQLRSATAGLDLRVGTVTLAQADRHRHRSWVERYEAHAETGRHGHVHGANLGTAASTYVALGGFRPLTHGEDHDLVLRAQRSGARIDWSIDHPVQTSARHVARAPRGVARDLVESIGREADDVA